jgi:hypothetical protein
LRVAAALAVALALAGAGCNGGGDGATRGAERTVTVAPSRPAGPGETLRQFVDAARTRDSARMWDLLSPPSRRRLGPTEARFVRGAARGIARAVAPLRTSAYEVIVNVPITPRFGIGAVAAKKGEKRFGAFAAALRLEEGAWRVELRGPVRIRPLRPDPGERLTRRGLTQLAATIDAGAPVLEAGFWYDGRAVEGRVGGLDPAHVTIYTETSHVPKGRHSVVVFASTHGSASALAWTFTA